MFGISDKIYADSSALPMVEIKPTQEADNVSV